MNEFIIPVIQINEDKILEGDMEYLQSEMQRLKRKGCRSILIKCFTWKNKKTKSIYLLRETRDDDIFYRQHDKKQITARQLYAQDIPDFQAGEVIQSGE